MTLRFLYYTQEECVYHVVGNWTGGELKPGKIAFAPLTSGIAGAIIMIQTVDGDADSA